MLLFISDRIQILQEITTHFPAVELIKNCRFAISHSSFLCVPYTNNPDGNLILSKEHSVDDTDFSFFISVPKSVSSQQHLAFAGI